MTRPQRLTAVPPDDRYTGHRIYPAAPSHGTSIDCVGREKELKLLRVVLGFDPEWRLSRTSGAVAPGCPRVRLDGTPGVGKRSMAREVARRAGLPFYEIQGHGEMSPEDLVLAIVPRETTVEDSGITLVLQASPLATALMWGGVAYFDALHRVSHNALGPLASLLDARSTLYSALTGLELTRRPDAIPFFFLCSSDPSTPRRLPTFLDQRTLPTMTLAPLAPSVMQILVGSLAAARPTELQEAGTREKRTRLHATITQEFEILQAAVDFAGFRRALRSLKDGNLLNALEALTDASAAWPQQRAVSRALQASIVSGLRRQALELAMNNQAAEAAEGSRIYLALVAADVANQYDRNNLAHCLLHEGKLEAALDTIRHEVTDSTPLAVAWVTHGEILQALGDLKTARDSYKRAAGLAPEQLPNGSTTRAVAEEYLLRLAQAEGMT